MPTLPSHARAVIIGGGIVGCSTAYHLARLGWKDLVLLEWDNGAQVMRPRPMPPVFQDFANDFLEDPAYASLGHVAGSARAQRIDAGSNSSTSTITSAGSPASCAAAQIASGDVAS